MLQGFGYAAPILKVYDIQIKQYDFFYIQLYVIKIILELIKTAIIYTINPQSYGDMYFRYCILKGYYYWGYKYLKKTYKQISSIINAQNFKVLNECK